MERAQNSRVNLLTSTCDLESRYLSHVLCTAHRTTKRNIWAKFHENGSNGSGDMERTRNSRANPLTLTCDLESRLLGYVLCTLSY